jgi:hypothetical protein
MMLTLCNFFSALSLVCFGICLMHFLFFCWIYCSANIRVFKQTWHHLLCCLLYWSV